MKKYLCLLIFVSFLYNCAFQDYNIKETYQQSINDAMVPENAEISYDLIAINASNNNLIWKSVNGEKYLLTVSWKSSATYYSDWVDSAYYDTGNYEIWVTTAPELFNLIKAERPQDVNMRLRQLLGLPPDAEYKYFVEFWVKAEDLFRPCPDAEIDDNHCQLCFDKTSDPEHINWINKNRIGSYYACDLYDKYPWTQLGYTYDWNPDNKTHIGLSEFVIKKHSKVIINKIYTTQEYFASHAGQ